MVIACKLKCHEIWFRAGQPQAEPPMRFQPQSFRVLGLTVLEQIEPAQIQRSQVQFVCDFPLAAERHGIAFALDRESQQASSQIAEQFQFGARQHGTKRAHR